MSVCVIISGIKRIKRAAVSGTEYPFHAFPLRKKKTIRDLSRANLSCGFRLMPKSRVNAAQPPSVSSAVIHSISVAFAGKRSRKETIW